MNIWIFNHYAVGPGASGGTRHYDLAREVSKHGATVTVFASSFEHQSRRERQFTTGSLDTVREERLDDVRFVWMKTCAYYKNDWRRVVNILGYTFRAFQAGLRDREHPDVIIGSLMHPLAALVGLVLAWLKGSTFYFEERDLWPQTLIDLGKVSEHHPVVWLLRRMERFLYRRAKRILVLFDKASEYVESQGIAREKVLFLPNGVDLHRYPAAPDPLPAELKTHFEKWAGQFVAVYIGSHGISDRLNAVLEVASVLQERDENFHFLLIGDGPEKVDLVRWKEERGLHNVTFWPPVPKEQIPAILARCQAGLMCLQDAELYKWGISFNKMYDYMAASLPIVLLSRWPESTLERSGGGVIVESPLDMSETLVQLAEQPEWAGHLGERGRAYVEEHHSWERLSGTLMEVIREDVCIETKSRAEKVVNTSAKTSKGHLTESFAKKSRRKRGMWLKGMADRVLAVLLLVPMLLIFLIIGLVIKVTSRGPVFFKQERAGRGGAPFQIWKFRTMVVDAEKQGDGFYTGESDPRITSVGNYLRKWSLDELPQVINIAKGEMSFIGPRPTLRYQVEQYDEQQRKRLRMRPGITGWAQVNGRNSLSWPERIELDIRYVEQWSLWLDLKILCKTVKVVFKSEGVYAGKEKFVITNKKEQNF